MASKRFTDRHIYPQRASLEGREMEIFKLVSYSATPEQWKEWLRVPLEHASARGNLDLFNKLLGAGAEGSAGWRGCRDRTLLDAAADGGNEDVVCGLLRAGAQPDVKVVSCSSGRSALYTATMLGHEDAARKLVLAGANTGVRDKHGFTPLHIAAANGLDGILCDLLLRGADKNARNALGDSPLMLAAQHGQVSAATTLLAAGANLRFRSGSFPRSALDWAAEKGHVRVLQAILDHGANVHSRDVTGATSLHVAVEYDQAGSVHALIDAGADIESETDGELTPLITAAVLSKRKAMLALLQRGADVNGSSSYGCTPLLGACLWSRPGVQAKVDLLLRWGADETAVDASGNTCSSELMRNPRASEGEIENTLLLLARAPADRAWRRRGWLVMLRSRASKATTVGYAASSPSDVKGGERSKGASDREGEGRTVARGENGGGVSRTASEQTRSGDGGAEQGVLGLDDVVEFLLGLAADGVFRTVVEFV